jgi:hypothetical protein
LCSHRLVANGFSVNLHARALRPGGGKLGARRGRRLVALAASAASEASALGKPRFTAPKRILPAPLVNSVHLQQHLIAEMHSTAAHPAGSAAGAHVAQPLASHAHTAGRGSWLRRVSSLLLRPAVLHTAGSATRLGASDQWWALGVGACHRSAILPPAATPSDVVDAAAQQRAASPQHADDQQEPAYLGPLSAEQRAAVTAPVDAHVRWAYWLISIHALYMPLMLLR